MKTKFCYSVLICSLALNTGNAQNLVLNSSFEDYTPNPSMVYLEDVVHHWFAYFTTPDYYSTDFLGEDGVEDFCGTLPRTGQAMVGGYQLGNFNDPKLYHREYIQGKLSEPLKANTVYYAEMYVKPMLKSPVINWGISNLGMAFTDKHYTTPASTVQFIIDEIPEIIHSAAPIIDRSEWTKISGCFIAQGGENSIIIGNFNKDEDTERTLIPGATGEDEWGQGMSYFLFDDILVKEMPEQGAYILPADTLICRDSTIQLTAYPLDAEQYTWSTGKTGNPLVVSQAGTYKVYLLTKEGCELEATARISTKFCGPVCPDLHMPNAFSPNEDGLNDHFQPMNNADITGMEMSIYNRWGERVFYGGNISSKWDGRYKDQFCDQGIYYYYIRYKDCYGAEKERKGEINLIR